MVRAIRKWLGLLVVFLFLAFGVALVAIVITLEIGEGLRFKTGNHLAAKLGVLVVGSGGFLGGTCMWYWLMSRYYTKDEINDFSKRWLQVFRI